MAKEKPRTIFLDMVGYSVKSRIWDWLLTFGELGFSKTDMVYCSGVQKDKGYKAVKWFEKERLILPYKKIRKGKVYVQLYKPNYKDIRIKALKNFFNGIIKYEFKGRGE